MLTSKSEFRPRTSGMAEQRRFSRRWHESPLSQGHFSSHQSGPPANVKPNEATEIASHVASMPASEVRRRYHTLMDKSLNTSLSTLERFEVERIEKRLDAEDWDAELDSRNREWDIERSNLIDGIESLLRKLRK